MRLEVINDNKQRFTINWVELNTSQSIRLKWRKTHSNRKLS